LHTAPIDTPRGECGPLVPDGWVAATYNRFPAISSGATMGKGDKRSKRGKIFKGSYGKTRPHDPNKKAAPAKPRPQRGTGSR
jgi:30S ribosomal protein S31